MDVRAILSLAVSEEGGWEINKDRQSRIQLVLPVGCVCVRCSNLCKRKGGGGEVSLRWEAREMLSSVYWNPPTMMDGHINSGIGQRFHLWWQPESGPVRLSLRRILMLLMTPWTVAGGNECRQSHENPENARGTKINNKARYQITAKGCFITVGLSS